MNEKKEQELKKIYLSRLTQAGYHTVPELIQILPPTIMNIINSSINTAEKLFVAALKSHMENTNKLFQGKPPEGFNKHLNAFGYLSINDIAEANPSNIAEALQINLEKAGEIVLYAMELSVRKDDKIISKKGEELIQDLDKEISHYLGQLERLEENQKLQVIVDNAVKKIQETIKMPSEEFKINEEQKKEMNATIQQFVTVFPSCTGFVLYNKRAEGIFRYSKDKQAKKTINIIHENISSLFWKISLALEERDEYGWINSKPHLIWIEAIRNKELRQQLAYIALFVFESESKDGVGTATPTIKGIIKEIERIIYGEVL